LALGTEVRPALSDADLLDFRPAHRARFILLLIDFESVLKFTAAVDPIQTGAKTKNAFGERVTDGMVEHFGFDF
jgi:hypothetical protein